MLTLLSNHHLGPLASVGPNTSYQWKYASWGSVVFLGISRVKHRKFVTQPDLAPWKSIVSPKINGEALVFWYMEAHIWGWMVLGQRMEVFQMCTRRLHWMGYQTNLSQVWFLSVESWKHLIWVITITYHDDQGPAVYSGCLISRGTVIRQTHSYTVYKTGAIQIPTYLIEAQSVLSAFCKSKPLYVWTAVKRWGLLWWLLL